VLVLVGVVLAGGLPIGLKEGGPIRRLGGIQRGQLELRLKLIMLLRGKLVVLLDRIWGGAKE
jgi:hypothetical protein